MKERISDVLAWFGLGYPIVLFAIIVTNSHYWARLLMPDFAFDGTGSYMVSFPFAAYIACGVLNYVLIGRMRLLPWK